MNGKKKKRRELIIIKPIIEFLSFNITFALTLKKRNAFTCFYTYNIDAEHVFCDNIVLFLVLSFLLCNMYVYICMYAKILLLWSNDSLLLCLSIDSSESKSNLSHFVFHTK